MLIGEDKWKELNDKSYTLATAFEDVFNDTRKFELDKTLQKNVSNIDNVKNLDLIPSSLKMIDIQDKLASAPQNKYYSNTPIAIIESALKPIIDKYDYVLIDCPPNLGIITLNGLKISKSYIIPAIPDILSTYGIQQIIARITEFSQTLNERIKCLGIVATKVRRQVTLHKKTLDKLAREQDAPLFKTKFYENSHMSEAAECTHVSTLKQKWGYQGQFDDFKNFASEIINKMER